MRAIFVWVLLILILAAFAYAFQEVPTLQRMQAGLNSHRRPLLVVSITAATLGSALFMAGAILLGFKKGERLTSRSEVNEQMRQVESQSAAPYSGGSFFYRFFGKFASLNAYDEFSPKEMKLAFRTGAWHSDALWRIRLTITIGALTMCLGLWAVMLTESSLALSFLLTVAIFYLVGNGIRQYRKTQSLERSQRTGE